jgi:hypothetical protein
MNTISKCQDIYTNNWLDFDSNVSHTSSINFYFQNGLQNLCDQMHGLKCSSIIKSHHHYKFFEKIDKKNIIFFYIYREPYSTLKSFWNYINYLQWWEGPKNTTLNEFILSKPEGMMLRYQNGQENNVFTRWKNHVQSWINASKTEKNIHVFKYDDLKNRYTEQVQRISTILNCNIKSYEKPNRNHYLKYDAKLKINQYEEMLVRNTIKQLNMSMDQKSNNIPLTVYQTFFTKNLPTFLQETRNKLIRLNPKFQFQLFDDNDCKKFLEENFDPIVLWAFNKLLPGSFKADLWRYAILYKKGGI